MFTVCPKLLHSQVIKFLSWRSSSVFAEKNDPNCSIEIFAGKNVHDAATIS
jgi:hypothetical protein